MKLVEIKRIPPTDARGFYTDPEDIISWMATWVAEIAHGDDLGSIKDVVRRTATIHSDGTVDWPESLKIRSGKNRKNKLTKLPVKFGKIKGDFECMLHELYTMEGCPQIVFGSFNVSYNKISSFEFAPKQCAFFAATANPFTSLVGISDHLLKTRAIHLSLEGLQHEVTEGGIGLLAIDGLDTIYGFNDKVNRDKSPWVIIASYLGRPDELFDCQAELVEKGFERFAKL